MQLSSCVLNTWVLLFGLTDYYLDLGRPSLAQVVECLEFKVLMVVYSCKFKHIVFVLQSISFIGDPNKESFFEV